MNKPLAVILKRFLVVGLLFFLIYALAACQLPSFGSPGEGESQAEPVLSTETSSPAPSEIPTLTLTPTKTLIPTETTKPTLRPSATMFVPTLRPSWTASPTLSPTATPHVHLFLEEDFTDIYSPWIKDSGSNWQTGQARQAYFMIVEAPNVEITSGRTWIRQSEVRIEADVWRGSGTGYYGFSCRETPAETYYSAFVTWDGKYGFGELRADRVNWFEVYPSDKIPKTVDTPIRLRVDCRGDALSLYINDELIDRYQVEGLGPGYVSMLAGTTFSDETVTVFFDNLQIWIP